MAVLDESVAQARRVLIIGTPALYCRGLTAALLEAGLDAEQIIHIDVGSAREQAGCVVLVGEAAAEGVAAYARLSSSPAIVVIAAQLSPAVYAQTLRAGATAVLGEDAPSDLVVETVSAALRGWTFLPTWMARELCVQAEEGGVAVELDAREIEWLKCLAGGMTISRLADRAGYSEREMYRCLHRLYARLEARSRTDALIRAARLGLIG